MAEGIWKGLSCTELRDIVFDIQDKLHGTSTLDWADICDKHMLDMHSDSLRKAASGVALMEAAGLDGDRGRDELQKKVLSDLRYASNDALRVLSRSGAIQQLIVESAERLQPYELRAARVLPHSENKSLVLVIADTHYGAEWTVHGLQGEVVNRYSPEIFEDRMLELLDHTITIIEKEEVSKVYVMLAGDALDGMLRPSQLLLLKYGVIESAMRFAEYFAAWLNRLSSYAVVEACFVPGNHGEIRPLGSRKGDFPDENAERIIPWWIQERLKSNKRIVVRATDKKMHMSSIHGYNIVLDHGDEKIKVEDVCRQAMLMYGKQIHYYICGHLHRRADIQTGYTNDGNTYVIRVPSIAGMDKFAQSCSLGGMPGATAFVLEERYGIRCSYPLNLRSK